MDGREEGQTLTESVWRLWENDQVTGHSTSHGDASTK